MLESELPYDIDTLFQRAHDHGASDIHLIVGHPPLMRVDGVIQPLPHEDEMEIQKGLKPEEVQMLVESVFEDSGVLLQEPKERFKREREIDLSYQVPSGVRFRVNCHFERDYMGLVARVIPDVVPSLEEVQMPQVAQDLTRLKQGIVLFTGPTGSGKSTSLAALIELINAERPVHIVTLEDPIEFVYRAKKAIIRQRQFGMDFLSFDEALRRVLRQDPDVILVGEMRDFETIAAALTLAETGHLVFATLHTNSAAQTIERIIDVFPPHQQEQVRVQLSMTLSAVIAQQLLPKKGSDGRVAAREFMVNTPAVANIIRDNRVPELESVIQTSAGEGMITLERDVARLYDEGMIEKEVALQYIEDERTLKSLLRG